MRRKTKMIGLSCFCIGMAAVLVAVVLSMRTFGQPNADAALNPSAQNTQAATRPLAAAADWAPAAKPENSSAAVLAALTEDAAIAAAKQGFRSAVLPNPFTSYSQQEASEAAQVLDKLEQLEVHRTLTLTPVDSSQLEAFGQALAQLIEESSFDALLLTDRSAEDPNGSATTIFADYLTSLLDTAGLASLPVIFDIGDMEQQATPYQEAMASLAQALETSELLAHCSPATAQRLADFAKQLGENTTISALFNIKDSIPNGTLPETTQFLSALEKVKDFQLVLQGCDFIPQNSEAAQLLAKLYSGALDLAYAAQNFALSRPFNLLTGEKTFSTDKPTATFTGTSSPLFPLTCNGKEVARNESGDFSTDVTLQPGKNVFRFSHQDKTVTVNVIYTVKVLDSVTPRGSFETTGGVEMAVGAKARRGATVKATLGTQTITLKPGSATAGEDENVDSEDDSVFISYTGSFKLAESGSKDRTLGTLKFTATYQGLTDVKNGAAVKLLAAVTMEPLPEPTTEATTPAADTTAGSTTTESTSGSTESGTDGTTGDSTKASTTTATTTKATTTASTTTASSGKLLTPYSNNGIGTAKMVEIKEGFANARWNGTTDTKYNPTASPLLAGTFDYVLGSHSSGGDTYYQLGSGKRIKAADLKIIEKGYKLPANSLKASSKIDGGALKMSFGLNWKVPFNVDVIGQSYSAAYGFNGNNFGVANFTATGLEIVFYHTTNYSGSISVSSFPLIASTQWSKDSAKQTVTLKLMFKNAGKFYGYQAYFENNQLVIRLKPRPSSSLKGKVIWLDAGHGGSDPGAPYVASHATLKHEKFVTLLIASKTKAKLEAQGATVYMSRTSDVYLSLQERVRLARAKNPDMFISVHTDSAESASPSGASAYYYKAYSQPFAKAIQSRIIKTYQNNIYTASSGISNYKDMLSKLDRGVKFYPFYVARMEECPAILIEYGFGSNLTECKVLQTDKNQDHLAQATVDGILDYLRAAQ